MFSRAFFAGIIFPLSLRARVTRARYKQHAILHLHN
jgi:hypothetical protein